MNLSSKSKFPTDLLSIIQYFGGGLITLFLLIGALAHFGAIYIFFKEFGLIAAVIAFFFPVIAEIFCWFWCLFHGIYIWYVMLLPAMLLIAFLFVAIPVFLIKRFFKKKMDSLQKKFRDLEAEEKEPIDVTPQKNK